MSPSIPSSATNNSILSSSIQFIAVAFAVSLSSLLLSSSYPVSHDTDGRGINTIMFIPTLVRPIVAYIRSSSFCSFPCRQNIISMYLECQLPRYAKRGERERDESSAQICTHEWIFRHTVMVHPSSSPHYYDNVIRPFLLAQASPPSALLPAKRAELQEGFLLSRFLISSSSFSSSRTGDAYRLFVVILYVFAYESASVDMSEYVHRCIQKVQKDTKIQETDMQITKE